ncbi:hypothetical protein [Calothrix sp. 336/3]|uniref:hypothetical protein n=1 Tax=Calothrix sp. 336/3 TaxID=1337936 RepID=UPI0004E39C6F|nr:hypothetical protein [Calothrix sp. 336/3]AKG21548.1 hypothetical protein IJ00_09920 [Calothrix sp. 336/3]
MLKRLIQWLKKLFQNLFGGKGKAGGKVDNRVEKAPPPPLTDTDLEFLFTQLLEGVHQARGQAWALKWLHNIEHRVPTERWVDWLQRFGDKLLASATPNNELASRLVALGEIEVGKVGDTAYDIGMQLLTRNQEEPIWEYGGPDGEGEAIDFQVATQGEESSTIAEGEELPEGEFQTVTLEELLGMMQEDENLRQLIAQQLGIETDDPEVIIQALIQQAQAGDEE